MSFFDLSLLDLLLFSIITGCFYFLSTASFFSVALWALSELFSAVVSDLSCLFSVDFALFFDLSDLDFLPFLSVFSVSGASFALRLSSSGLMFFGTRFFAPKTSPKISNAKIVPDSPATSFVANSDMDKTKLNIPQLYKSEQICQSIEAKLQIAAKIRFA